MRGGEVDPAVCFRASHSLQAEKNSSASRGSAGGCPNGGEALTTGLGKLEFFFSGVDWFGWEYSESCRERLRESCGTSASLKDLSGDIVGGAPPETNDLEWSGEAAKSNLGEVDVNHGQTI